MLAGTYFVSITEISSSNPQVGNGALLIVKKYFLGKTENKWLYLFDSHRIDKNDNISAATTAADIY